VIVAVKAVVIVEAKEMEDSNAEETGAQLQAPNNKKWSSFHMGLEENARQWVTILSRTISSKLFKRPTRTVRILRYPYKTWRRRIWLLYSQQEVLLWQPIRQRHYSNRRAWT
jgi:hypothetical protein